MKVLATRRYPGAAFDELADVEVRGLAELTSPRPDVEALVVTDSGLGCGPAESGFHAPKTARAEHRFLSVHESMMERLDSRRNRPRKSRRIPVEA